MRADLRYELVYDFIDKWFLSFQGFIREGVAEILAHVPMLSRVTLAHDRMSFVGKDATIVPITLDESIMALPEVVNIPEGACRVEREIVWSRPNNVPIFFMQLKQLERLSTLDVIVAVKHIAPCGRSRSRKLVQWMLRVFIAYISGYGEDKLDFHFRNALWDKTSEYSLRLPDHTWVSKPAAVPAQAVVEL